MAGPSVVLVVDMANVVGSRPDGWWRDRAGAASRLLEALGPLVGASVPLADGEPVRLERIVAVLEGQARAAGAGDRIGETPVEVRLAPADGDTTIVAVAVELVRAGLTPLVVTADRGLRERLPAGVRFIGPGRLRDQLS